MLIEAPYVGQVLRYPGSKWLAGWRIAEHMPNSVDVVSPFLGGGGLELRLLARGQRVIGSDIDFDLVNFWRVLLTRPSELSVAVEKYWPSERASHLSRARAYRSGFRPESQLERAAYYYALRQQSFSGKIGGWRHESYARESSGAWHEHLSHRSYRLRDFRAPGLSVSCMDFSEAIERRRAGAWLYLDPPYVGGEANYGMRSRFDHEGLARRLRGEVDWLMSYGESSLVRELYSDCYVKRLTWNWFSGARRGRRGRPYGEELLIAPVKLPGFARVAREKRKWEVMPKRSFSRQSSFLDVVF